MLSGTNPVFVQKVITDKKVKAIVDTAIGEAND